MKNILLRDSQRVGWSLLAGCLAVLGAGCQRGHEARWQGYLEGEFVYVASPLAGRLDELAVTKGTSVQVGAALFTLERSAEIAAQRQAEDQLRAAEARLADLRKGARPSELAALAARVEQARSAAHLAGLEFKRLDELHRTSVVSESDFDRARLALQQSTAQQDELTAQLETARLGGRPDAIAAAEAEVGAARAAKLKADWAVEQKAPTAPRAGFVQDTVYRAGEYVGAGSPVVVLLPPENLKVRFFVPEADLATLNAGEAVSVHLSGRPPLPARVSFISAQPEYTPPILYNRENRSKLVFMVEAQIDGTRAGELHPGQPVDVTRTSTVPTNS